MKFALLKYNTMNLGDDIQSIAARRFLPSVDVRINRDRLDEYRGFADEPTALICSGWWTHRAATWPPPPVVRPLLISMHVCERPDVLERFLSPRLRAFYEEHGPVGCRDTRTLELFQNAGVPSYFSGCLTLTLTRSTGPRDGGVVFADPFGSGDLDQTRARVGDRWWTSIPEEARRNAVFVTHRVPGNLAAEHRLHRAEALLDTYRRAKLVITGRLHAALPCLAMGTPVILVESTFEPSRFTGLAELVTVVPPSEALDGRWNVDWASPPPPPNLDRLETLRAELTRRCEAFIKSRIAEAAA